MERYVIGQDFNTKNWFVYDNETNYDICFCNTEEDAKAVVAELVEADDGYCWMCGGGIDGKTAIDIVRKGGIK